MTSALFDSNIVIDLLAGRPEALAEFRAYQSVAISVVTWIEVMAAVDKQGELLTRRSLAGYPRIALDQTVAAGAATIRRERRIKLPDAIIQASAEAHGLLLVTRNEKDFPAGTRGVRVPYRL